MSFPILRGSLDLAQSLPCSNKPWNWLRVLNACVLMCTSSWVGTMQVSLTGRFLPTIDLVEAKNQFEVTVDLPGLEPDDVEVELKNGDLWISGRREEKKEEEGKTFHRIERHHGEFRRILPLPTAIDAEQIEAKFDNGVLTIIIPKTEEAKAKHIKVKT